jgi:ferredoxin
MRAWRILQELAGLHNEYARRAAEQATEEALAEAERQKAELEAAHAEQVEQVRSAAAGEAMDRLVAVLMDLDTVPAAAVRTSTAPPAVAEVAEAPAAEAEPAPVVEEEDEDEISFSDPYINTILCTTCNECINLNTRMFVYNENRQAVIGDASAGTFEQLVKAAEKCPARCIHPGAPRSGDATVTDELIARAKPFN